MGHAQAASVNTPQPLARVIGVPGAVLMGLGSIVGTGIFVSVGIAAGVAGDGVLAAVVLGAAVAAFNGLSSAQLAASHPVSGGTYEYGYRYLNPTLGFAAGWVFLCAKSASAATAALGFAGYLLAALGETNALLRIFVGMGLIAALTAVIAAGMKQSSALNAIVVSLTLAGLGAFVLAGAPGAIASHGRSLASSIQPEPGLFHATALMFVAYTGYGRIATLGEEVKDPARSIPRAIVLTLALTLALYVSVTFVAIRTVGAPALAEATRASAAPLQAAARQLELPWVARLVGAAAITAMTGVVLNLLLGLSRVLLAMSRRHDMPGALDRIDANGSPRRAVIVTGFAIAALVAIGDVKTTWSFSAFSVLVYYALTNLAALRLPAEQRRFPRWVAAAGLVSCVGLAFWVERVIWLSGLALIAVGLLWHRVARRLAQGKTAG